jgi:hypothetical protein
MDAGQYDRPAGGDRLEQVRACLRVLRDKECEASDLTQRLRELGSQINEFKHKTLVDVFQEAGVDSLGLPAEGNLPAYDAKLGPYYKANIAAEWDEKRRQAGFQVLEDMGHGEVIRTVVTVSLGRGERERAKQLLDLLAENKFDCDVGLGVPWNTLTALVRSEHEARRPFSDEQLEKIGAQVGLAVQLKQRKEEK